MFSLETNGIENQEDVEEVYERKRLRKRQRSSPSDKSPVKNGDMSEEPKPKKKKKSKHKDKESELLGMTAPPPSIATPAPRKGNQPCIIIATSQEREAACGTVLHNFSFL